MRFAVLANVFGLFFSFAVQAKPDTVLGFRCADDPLDGPSLIELPRDFQSHPEYRLEWWYYTGNLKSKQQQDLGFQLTLIRLGVLPTKGAQTYMAHVAITAPHVGKGFYFGSKTHIGNRKVLIRPDPFVVSFTKDRTLFFALTEGEAGQVGSRYFLSGHAKDQESGTKLAVNLHVKNTKGSVLQGNKGYSKKSPGRCSASNYFSESNLELDPILSSYLKVGDTVIPIESGKVWMDHEYSTPNFSNLKVSWDWFNVKLDNGMELMFFRLRNRGGAEYLQADGTVIFADATKEHLEAAQFQIEAVETWKSPKTKTTYPVKWKVHIPKLNLAMDIDALIPNQEWDLKVVKPIPFLRYWEGATKITAVHQEKPVSGTGYTELFGY